MQNIYDVISKSKDHPVEKQPFLVHLIDFGIKHNIQHPCPNHTTIGLNLLPIKLCNFLYRERPLK